MKASRFRQRKSGIDGAEKQYISGTVGNNDTGGRIGRGKRDLKTLRERGCKLAIGSSSKNAKFILEKVELLNAFDAISDGNNITHSKPDPEVFLKAGEFLGEDPANCVVVEDAYAGIDAAKAAGMLQSVWGMRSDMKNRCEDRVFCTAFRCRINQSEGTFYKQ
mgnify:CR=1 FL=1